MTRKIIIISGKQLSGKDTTANALAEALPGFKRAALADAIKRELAQQKELTFNEIDRNKFMYRSELIVLGNKRRAEDPDYWINKVIEKEGDLIISDIRMLHEIETFKKENAIMIRVEADRDERIKRGIITEENDATETQLDNFEKWDYVLKNDGDVEQFTEKVQELAKEIENRFMVK